MLARRTNVEIEVYERLFASRAVSWKYEVRIGYRFVRPEIRKRAFVCFGLRIAIRPKNSRQVAEVACDATPRNI